MSSSRSIVRLPHRRLVLGSGVVVLIAPQEHSSKLFLLASVDTGARCESAAKAGLAQLAVRILEEGSERYPGPELARVIEAVGGTFEAQSFRGFAYVDPDSDYVFWHSSTATPPISINFTQVKDQEIDTALDEARTVGGDDRKPYYDQVVKQLNSQLAHIWLYNTPYALIAAPEVRGLNGARQVPFGNFLPKTWWGDVWLEQS